MMHIAVHPTSFDAFAAGPVPPTPAAFSFDAPMSPASLLTSLPRTLARPALPPISRDAIARASPELKDVPLEYIRSGLKQQAPK
jgi:hypothetical protein